MAVGERTSSLVSACASHGVGRRTRSSFDGAAQLGDVQHARILGAVFDIAADRGASNMTVATIVERAGVSRRTFYEFFSDRDDCVLAAFGAGVSRVSERVLPAYQAENGWREKIRAALTALLGFFDEQPLVGRFLIVESAIGGSIEEARSAIINVLIGAIDEGRAQGKTSVAPSWLTAEGVVGGVLSVIHSRLAQEREESLLELRNPLMGMIVLPYLGAAAARRELDRPTPISTGKGSEALWSSDPFKDVGMRLTYRTSRALSAIADHPGASNRLVADTADIHDQGQVSKLLTRLEHVGVIENTGLGVDRGAPNAWTLTPQGQRLADSIRAYTSRPGFFKRGMV